MKQINSLSHSCDASKNAQLYEFLATNQDIDDLATKIYSAKYCRINFLKSQNNNEESA